MGLLYGRRRGSSRVWLDFARIVSYNILAWIPRVSAVSAALARRHPCQNRIPGCGAVGSAPALGVPWRYPGQGKVKRRKVLRHLHLRGFTRLSKTAQKRF